MAKKGVFERIRDITPYAFGFFAFTLVIFFTIGDITVVESIFGGNFDRNTSPVAIVNGDKVLYADFEKEVKQQIDQQTAQSQDPEQKPDDVMIRRQVFSSLIEELIMKQQAAEVGVLVTDAEIQDIFLNNPPEYLKQSFIDSAGVFQKQLYLELITNPENVIKYMFADPTKVSAQEKDEAVSKFRNDILLIEGFLRKQKLQEGLMAAVNTAGSIISSEYAKEKYLSEKSFINMDIISLNPDVQNVEEIEISDADIQEYYNKNKRYYQQKPQRQIKYVALPIQPSTEDTMRADRRAQTIMQVLREGSTLEAKDSIFDIKIAEYAGEKIDYTLIKDLDRIISNFLITAQDREVIGPVRLQDGTYFFRLDGRRSGEQEVIKASHILISTNDNADSAKIEADKIYKMAKSGEDFAKLAQEYSKDPGSGMKGGDLGYFGKGQMVKPFEEAAFAAKIGEITKPVESQFGYHIIKVVDKKSDEIAYSQIKLNPSISQVTHNKIKRDAFSFKQQLEENVAFDTLAARMELTPVETSFFEKNRPILKSQYLTDLAFDANIGTVFEPIEIPDYGLVIAMVTDEKKAGIVSLEDKKDEIKQILVKEKKLDELKAKADNIYKKLNGDINNIANVDPSMQVTKAENVNLSGSIPSVGRDLRLSTAAFAAPLNKLYGPIRGENGYYIITVTSKIVPDDKQIESELPEYVKNLKRTAGSSIFYQWLQNEKEQANIEDFRKDIYRQY